MRPSSSMSWSSSAAVYPAWADWCFWRFSRLIESISYAFNVAFSSIPTASFADSSGAVFWFRPRAAEGLNQGFQSKLW